MTIRLDAHKPEFHRAAPPQLPVRVATTANITLSGTQTIDGVAVVAEDRVLAKDQTTGADRGLYICKAGAWERSFDMAEGVAAWGAVIYVIAGTANGGKIFRNTNATLPTIGVTSLTFTEFLSGISGITVDDEGTPLTTAATTLDFVGALVVASGTGATKTITVNGTLNDLSDVTITSVATLDRIHWNGSAWVNTAAIWRPLMDGAGAVVVDGGTGEAIMALS